MKTNTKINFSMPSWSFSIAMLATVFANESANEPDFKNTFDEHVVQFLAGVNGRLDEHQAARFQKFYDHVKMLDPDFDVQNDKLPAIVWLNLAFKIWLEIGGAPSQFFDSYTKWRSRVLRRNQLILVAPEPVASNIVKGLISGAEIGTCPDCYSLDMFLIAKAIQPSDLRARWRVVRVPMSVPLENYLQKSKQAAPTTKSRTFQEIVGVANYEQAERAIRDAAQDQLLGRKLSRAVDKKTNKYLYQGRREDLLKALKAKGCEIVAGREVALKLISHFVQCRKGSLASRKSVAPPLKPKLVPKRLKAR